MKYIVNWRPLAERELGELWLNTSDRDEVAHAADTLDSMLAEDPHLVGESRGGVSRLAFQGPLVMAFDVIEDDRRVDVVSIWRVKLR